MECNGSRKHKAIAVRNKKKVNNKEMYKTEMKRKV